MKRILVLATSLGLLTTGGALSGDIKERTSFFMVRGSTFNELDRVLGVKGLLLGTGKRHAGRTDVNFKVNVTYKSAGGSCGLDRMKINLNLHTTLPRWSAPQGASPETRLLWKTLRDDIVTHEARHASIAKTWLTRLEETVRNLPRQATCASMEASVNAAKRKVLLQHHRAQLGFDANARQIDARLKVEPRESASRLAAR